MLSTLRDLATIFLSIFYNLYVLLALENPLFLRGTPEEYVEGCTKVDLVGPEYKLFPPVRKFSLIDSKERMKQPKVRISGHVMDKDKKPIPKAKIDIWHPDNNGTYSTRGYDCRGVIVCDDKGYYEFETALPRYISISSLFQNSFLKNYMNEKSDTFRRPAHFHFIISYNNKKFGTQVYTSKEFLNEDSVRVKTFGWKPNENFVTIEKGQENEYSGTFDFVLP